jgi:GGDEF domain-containing protein
VDEKLSEVIGKDGVAVLFVSIENMDAFREAYGFVASDDVLRAISLMVMNTMREVSRPEDFLGHFSGTDFILVVPPSNLAALSEKLRARLEQSVEYFYPIKDREQMAKRANRLGAKLAEVASLKGPFTTADQVKAELVRLKK